MAPGENWTTMRRKSPSSPKPSTQLPAKQLISPLLPVFAPSAPRPVSTTSSAERAADGCSPSESYWDQPDHQDWDFDNTMYCDSTGCSYDARKNPRVAKYAVTVAEFDDCSYEEYEDTVFLCGQCNMKCLRKVNGSKIKLKMPIEQFLAQRDGEEDSFSAAALDLPLPPPKASDFPALPRAAPAPKMTKAEKSMANKINALLLSSDKAGVKPGPAPTSAEPAQSMEAPPLLHKTPPVKAAPVANKINALLLPSDEAGVKPGPAPTSAEPAQSMEAPPLLHKTPPVKAAPAPTASIQLAGVIPIPTELRSQILQNPPGIRAEVLTPSPRPSGTSTPIMAMATFHAEHAVSCAHDTGTCGVCRIGITCCKCRVMYTAPAAKRMRCATCLHWACDLDQSIGCCECDTPWVPLDVFSSPPPTQHTDKGRAIRFRGGAGSDNASLASSADTTKDDSTVKIKISAPTQESVDEIDAFSRPPSTQPGNKEGKGRRRRHPKSGQSSHEPSRPTSVASDRLSTTETVLPKPDYDVPPLAHEYAWSTPPADVTALPGYIYEAHQEKTLHVDDDDVTHFVKRGNMDINDLSNQLDVLLSGNTSWKTIYHAITDLFQFDSIIGSRNDFICLLIGLARSWDDDAECNPAGIVKALINDASSLVKAEEELHLAQTSLSRIRNERNQALTDVKKLSETTDRLRKDRNTLKAAMQDIVNSGGVAPTAAQFEELQQEVALLKDEKAGLTKVIEHDKTALRAAEDDNVAFTLQVSLMNEDIDDKNALIEECQAAATDMLKKYGDMEILATSAKRELESAMSVISTMKVQQESERKVYESRIQRLKARTPTESKALSTTGNTQLRKELAVAKERVAFLEKAYKEKSEALKATTQKSKAQQAQPKTTEKNPDTPKWGFEPPDDLPRSQPYWDYRNAYSDHIAAMVAATVSAIPHIPLSSAISSAITTVSKAGPPPELAQKAKGKRAAGGSRPTSPAPTRPPLLPTSPSPPVIPKPSPPPVLAHAKLTMAQILAGAGSFSGGSEASAVQAAKEKKVTWRMKETSKQIVNKPGARGTRATELHLRIPRCDATTTLYKSSGSRLINEVIALLNKGANSDEIQAYKANPLVSAKWSARSNLLLKCSQPMGEMLKVALERSIRKNIPEGQVDEDSDVEVLNRPPTTSLKFMAVPRYNEDGSPTDSADLYSDIKANPAWADVSFFSDPKFLSNNRNAASGIVVLTIVDDEQGNVGKKLMRTMVSFSGANRPCLRWVDMPVQPFCGQCMMWGHGGFNCTSNILRCSKCGEGHDYKNHEKFCETCQKGAGHICVPKCFNCLGNHLATSKDCDFYKHRTDREWQVDTFKKHHPSANTLKKRDENRAKNKAGANETPDWVRRRMAGDYSAKPDDDDDGFTKVGRKGKKVTFPFEEPSARIDQVQEEWDDGKDQPPPGSISPIEYINRVIASHAPSHMKDRPTKEKAQHVEDEVSRLKQRLESFLDTTNRTKRSGKGEKPERVPSPVVIDLVTPEVQHAGSPEVPSL